MDEIRDIANRNVQRVLEDGPGLRYDTGIFVIAKDTQNGRVLLGGLGGMGVGQMWFSLTAFNKTFTGYESAPDIDSTVQDARWDYFKAELQVWDRPIAERPDDGTV